MRASADGTGTETTATHDRADAGSIRAIAILATVALSFAAACAPPFAAKRNVLGAEKQATATVISTGEPSRRTRNVLYDRDLVGRYRKDPVGALAELHADLVAGRLPPEAVGALAELCFHHARKGGGQPYYLASALYAWAFLFPDDRRLRPDRFDPFVRLNNDLYNRGVSLGLPKGDRREFRSGGPLRCRSAARDRVGRGALRRGGRRLDDFLRRPSRGARPLRALQLTGARRAARRRYRPFESQGRRSPGPRTACR